MLPPQATTPSAPPPTVVVLAIRPVFALRIFLSLELARACRGSFEDLSKTSGCFGLFGGCEVTVLRPFYGCEVAAVGCSWLRGGYSRSFKTSSSCCCV